MRARAFLLLCLGACEKPQVTADSGRVAADTAATRSVSAPNAKPPCPATGNWAECSVVERLDRAGLVPRKDSVVPAEPPLSAPGILLRVGNSELELYIYPDLAARERDEAKLERTKYADYSTALGMKPLPTLIASANLIAILHSRNEHQRERIGDALTAGPPQPARQ